MNGTTHKIRRRIATVVLGVAAAAIGAPTAPAGDRIVDDWFRDAPAVNTTSQVSDRIVDDYFRDSPAAGTLAAPQEKGLDGDYMLRDYLNGTHFQSQQAESSSNGGLDLGNIGIGIVGAVCGLLLLTALGIGARQVRHTRHRLGSA